jgi:hypothetical protein
VEHQMLPLESWGTAYAVAPAADAKGNGDCRSVYRVSAGFDGTELVYTPSAPAGAPLVLDAYETVEVVTDQPFAVASTDPEKPFSVTQFLLSNQEFGGLLNPYPGDPSMMVLPAVDQLQLEYVFLVPNGYATNYVTVVRGSASPVNLDGVPISAVFSPLATYDGVDYQYIHVELAPGRHVIDSEGPLSIVVVGYDSDVSFGYPGRRRRRGDLGHPRPAGVILEPRGVHQKEPTCAKSSVLPSSPSRALRPRRSPGRSRRPRRRRRSPPPPLLRRARRRSGSTRTRR